MINYPAGIQNKKKTTQFKDRGMSLETVINKTNEFYLKTNKAVIYKKPTPIKIIKIDSKNERITSAYFDKHSTTDYNGVYNGKYIDFEAKSTTSKTSIPLANFQKCQIEHFRRICRQKAVAFVIIEFSTLETFYLFPAEKLLKFIDTEKRRSIPYTFIKEEGYMIKRGINPDLDYLKIIDEYF